VRLEFERLLRDESLSEVPFLLLLNKQDLAAKLARQIICERLGLQRWQEKRTICVQECSAATGQGVLEGLDLIIEIYEKMRIEQKVAKYSKNTK
jgi:ribosome biogenesis GTPase A